VPHCTIRSGDKCLKFVWTFECLETALTNKQSYWNSTELISGDRSHHPFRNILSNYWISESANIEAFRSFGLVFLLCWVRNFFSDTDRWEWDKGFWEEQARGKLGTKRQEVTVSCKSLYVEKLYNSY